MKKHSSAKENKPVLKNRSAVKLKYLFQSYVSQLNRYACSAASVVMMINAIHRGRGVRENFRQITQQELLAAVDAVHWRERLSRKGYNGRHGVTITDLKIICKAALNAYEISYETVDVLQLNETMPDLNAKKDQVHRQLSQMSASEDEFILAYFTQGELVGNWFGSHVSPLGSFDPQEQTVLVLDVDPEVNGSYRVSFDRFFNSLVGSNNTYHRRGGGWVRIRIKP